MTPPLATRNEPRAAKAGERAEDGDDGVGHRSHTSAIGLPSPSVFMLTTRAILDRNASKCDDS
jgi:hypothetical protein